MIGSTNTGVLVEGFPPTIGINSFGGVDTWKNSHPIINFLYHWIINGTNTGIDFRGIKVEPGFTLIITTTTEEDKAVLTITQESGINTIDINNNNDDSATSYDDTKIKNKIFNLEHSNTVLNREDTVNGSVSSRIAKVLENFHSITFKKVNELPNEGEDGVFYLVPSSTFAVNNIYNEYVYLEFLGSTEINLEYAKKTEIPNKTSYLVNNSLYITNSDLPGTSSTTTLDLVTVDGNTIIIDNNGVISGAKEITISAYAGNTLVNKY